MKFIRGSTEGRYVKFQPIPSRGSAKNIWGQDHGGRLRMLDDDILTVIMLHISRDNYHSFIYAKYMDDLLSLLGSQPQSPCSPQYFDYSSVSPPNQPSPPEQVREEGAALDACIRGTGWNQNQQPKEAGGVCRPERASNTIFKTSLGEFRKAILDVVSGRPIQAFLKAEIKACYIRKNQAVFPKLLSVIREAKIYQEVVSVWSERSKKLIRKKEALMERGEYKVQRLEQLEKNIDVMDRSLQEQDFWASFQVYWGQYKQTEKYEKCRKEVKVFRERLVPSFRKCLLQLQQKQVGRTRRSKKKSLRIQSISTQTNP